MQSLTKIICPLVFAALLFGCKKKNREPAAPAKVQNEVRRVFDDYRNAILSEDGKTVAELVDVSSLHYYATLRRLALNAPAAILKTKSINTRLVVLHLRHSLDVDHLRSMNAKELLAFVVDRGPDLTAASYQDPGGCVHQPVLNAVARPRLSCAQF